MSDFTKRLARALLIVATLEVVSAFVVWAWQFNGSYKMPSLVSEPVLWLTAIMLFALVIAGDIARDRELNKLREKLLDLERSQKNG